mmetsp:Transcript_8363/g.20597  ORF Transcript_8363/g.20597 Transcript_8363/m.20597 type:complete len:100 (+) Transcript_8363:123-422(+)
MDTVAIQHEKLVCVRGMTNWWDTVLKADVNVNDTLPNSAMFFAVKYANTLASSGESACTTRSNTQCPGLSRSFCPKAWTYAKLSRWLVQVIKATWKESD